MFTINNEERLRKTKFNYMTELDLKNESHNDAKPVLPAVPSVVYNEDCVEGLKRFSDNYFDLAIVDPPYSLNIENSGTMFKKFGATKGWDNVKPTNDYWRGIKKGF